MHDCAVCTSTSSAGRRSQLGDKGIVPLSVAAVAGVGFDVGLDDPVVQDPVVSGAGQPQPVGHVATGGRRWQILGYQTEHVGVGGRVALGHASTRRDSTGLDLGLVDLLAGSVLADRVGGGSWVGWRVGVEGIVHDEGQVEGGVPYLHLFVGRTTVIVIILDGGTGSEDGIVGDEGGHREPIVGVGPPSA